MGGANLRPTKILKGKEMLSVFRIIGLALLLTALTFASSSVGGVQLVSNYTSVQVSTVSFYVNSVDFRPVPGQQCPFSVYYGGVLPQNLLAVVNPFPTAGAGACGASLRRTAMHGPKERRSACCWSTTSVCRRTNSAVRISRIYSQTGSITMPILISINSAHCACPRIF